MRDLIEEIELADQVGLDVFGVGEHHRPDFAVSAPAVALAAAAERTERIRLTSAVSVISSDDPVRVFQDFATLDLLSGGRAEIMAGRGSFVESFPLFGYDLDDYDELFAEKLELLLAVRGQTEVTWDGRLRPPIDRRGVYPRPLQDPLPVWVAVGGSPESAIRTGRLGLPMALAIIGGEPARFKPFAELHAAAAAEAGAPPPALSINSHGFVAPTSQAAADLAFPPFARMMDRIGRERGWQPMTPRRLRSEPPPRGRQLRRLPRRGRREDPRPARDLQPRPLPDPVQRRHPPPRRRDALDRALRHRGRPPRPPRTDRRPGAERWLMRPKTATSREVSARRLEEAGRLVHGPGRLWPWPRRPRVRERSQRPMECHGSPRICAPLARIP